MTLNTSSATNVPIIAYRGDSMIYELTLTDDNDQPVDLSTATLLMQVRKKHSKPVEVELSEGAGITVSGAGNNIVTLDKIINIDAGQYWYDLQGTFGDGTVTTYMAGSFRVIQDITQ